MGVFAQLQNPESMTGLELESEMQSGIYSHSHLAKDGVQGLRPCVGA